MSGSPRQFPEEQNIFVAIPPPLVPLARQLGSSHDSSSTHLPTPISTNNSSASQSYAHWTLDNQYQRANAAPQGSSGGPEFAVLGSRPEPSVPETYARPPIAFLPPMDSTSLADSYTRPQRTQLVSPPVANMPTQLLNRLYSFSTVSNSTSTPSSISPPPRTSGSGSAPNSGSYFPPNAVVGGTAVGARSFLQHPSLDQSPELRRGSTSSMTESTRTAAASAIVDTLNRGEARPSRGDSPYIPSSLSMLFSDPEVMLAQEEVERAQLYQQQQQMRQRYMDSQRTFSGEAGFSIGLRDTEDGAIEDYHDDQNHGENQLLLRPDPQREMGFGYEVVQDEPQERDYHPYATVMSRADYLAPHEPSSSSPLFPSPLTTLGRFTRISNPLAEQRAQAGRIWQDYGAMDDLQHEQTDMATPLNQSHAAYYHAVSNYHYSSQDDINNANRSRSRSSTVQQPCQPAGHYAVPENGQWRRQRGRDNSLHSFAGVNAGEAGENRGWRNWFQCRQGDGPDEHWLCGINLLSIISCWVCCETPLACCSGCCI